MKFYTALQLMMDSYICCTRSHKIGGVKLADNNYSLTPEDIKASDWVPDIRATLAYRNRFVPFPEAEDINSTLSYITDKLIELGKLQEREKN